MKLVLALIQPTFKVCPALPLRIPTFAFSQSWGTYHQVAEQSCEAHMTCLNDLPRMIRKALLHQQI